MTIYNCQTFTKHACMFGEVSCGMFGGWFCGVFGGVIGWEIGRSL